MKLNFQILPLTALLGDAHLQRRAAGQPVGLADLGLCGAIGSQLRDTWSLMAVRNVRVQLIPMETTKAVRAFDDRVVSTLLTMPR